MRVHLLCVRHNIIFGGEGRIDRNIESEREEREKSDLENQLLLKCCSIVKSRKMTGKKVIRIKRRTQALYYFFSRRYYISS